MNPLEVPVQLKPIESAKIVTFYRGLFDDIAKQAEQSFKKIKSPLMSGVVDQPSSRSRSGSSDNELQKALRDIQRMKDANIRAENEITAHISKQAEIQYQARTKQWQRGLAEFQRISKHANGSGGFNSGNNFNNSGDFFGGLFGNSSLGRIATAGSAAGAAAAGILIVKDAITATASAVYDLGEKSLNAASRYEKIDKALTASIGSSLQARQELKLIDDTARNTNGLRLETAEQGFQNLRTLGFETIRAKRIIKELGEEKILSGASNEQLERVIFNFTQIASGGQKVGQEIREILTALPSLQKPILDAFGSLSGAKIQSQLDKLGTDAFFDKLLDALEKNKAAAGGLEDAYGKLADEAIIAGRELALPVLPEVTNDIRDLTQFIRENSETWQSWGQNIKGAYIVVRDTLKDIQRDTAERLKKGDLSDPSSNFNGLQAGNDDFISKFIRQKLDETSKGLKAKAAGGRSYEDIQKEVLRITEESTNAGTLLMEREKLKQEAIQNAANEKELAGIQDKNNAKLSSLRDYYRIEEALITSSLTFSTQQEIEQTKKLSSVHSASIRAEIKNQTEFFNRQIDLYEGNESQIEKITLQKNQTIGKLNTELRLNEINTQKEIAQLEFQIFEKRRQDAITFKQLQIRELQQSFDSKNFDITRNISLGNNIEQSFNQLKDLTQKNFEDISRITIEQYQRQLENRRLTAEERTNLEKQMYLDLQDLAEGNRQKQVQITDNQVKEQIDLIQKSSQRIQSLYQGQIGIYGSLSPFISPDSFSSASGKSFSDSVFGEVNNLQTQIGIVRGLLDGVKSELKPLRDSVTLTDEQTRSFNDLLISENKLDTQLSDLVQTQGKLKDSISGTTVKIVDFIQKLADGKGKIEDFDTASKMALQSRQTLEREVIDSQLRTAKQLKQLAIDNEDKKSEYEQDSIIGQLTQQKTILGLKQGAENLDLYRNSLIGLKEQLKNIQSGDKGTLLGLERIFQEDFYREQISDATEILRLQYEIANSPVIDSQKVQIAQLETILDLRKQEENAVIAIAEAQIRLSQANVYSPNQVRARVLTEIQQSVGTINDALSAGIIDAFDKGVQFLDERLGKLAEIPILGDLLKFGNRQFMANLTTTLMDTFLPPDLAAQFKDSQMTVSDKISESNKYLKRIADAVTPNVAGVPVPSGGGFGGGFWGSLAGIASGTFGGGRVNIGSNMPGYPYVMNYDGTNPIYTVADDGYFNGAGGLGSRTPQQSIWERIKSVFGGNGKIWGDKGFGWNSGTIQGIGGLASLAGGFVPGVGGSILGGIGSGIGAASSLSTILGISAIGGPLGLAIGGVVGGLVGLGSWLFGNSKQRKQDEVTRTQAYNSVTQQFDEMIYKLTKQIPPGIDPLAAKTRGSELINEYNTAMNQLKDSKTRRIALGEVTNSNGIIYRKNQELQAAIEVAQGRLNNRNANQGFTGMFANGVFIDDAFRRYNGMMGGVYSGKDYIKALIGDGEMVLNPRQIESVKRRAGFDAFDGAGIPNYKPEIPKPSVPKFATGVSFASPVLSSNSPVQPQLVLEKGAIEIYVNGERITDADIESISIRGVETYRKQKGRISKK